MPSNFTENFVDKITNDLLNGNFDEHRAWDCAVTATNNKAALDKLLWRVRKFQNEYEDGKCSRTNEIKYYSSLGEIAAKHYIRVFPEYQSWDRIMDMPTRCACGRRIARLLWEH